jgi:hypothetical protein
LPSGLVVSYSEPTVGSGQPGRVEAPDEAGTMEKAAAEFKMPANRLMAIQR